MHIKTLIKMAIIKSESINRQMVLVSEYQNDWAELANRSLTLIELVNDCKNNVASYHTEQSLRTAFESADLFHPQYEVLEKQYALFIKLKTKVFS